MARSRTLYICPATEAAIVAAAPLLAKDEERVFTKAVVLKGLTPGRRPSEVEMKNAVRPGRAIVRDLQARGLDVRVLEVDAGDDGHCRRALAKLLAEMDLSEIDGVLLNCQAGTKQMAFGAWDALNEAFPSGSAKANFSISRCFIAGGRVSYTPRGKPAWVPPLGGIDHLALYGYREIESRRARREAWCMRRRDWIGQIAEAKGQGNGERLTALLDERYGAGDWNPWSRASFAEGGGFWLEAHLFQLTARAADLSKRRWQVHGGLTIRDEWAPRRVGTDGTVLADDEIDVVVFGGGAMHIIEAKDRDVQQKMIDRLASLRGRLQGRAGVTALVSPRPWTRVLGDHAEAVNVRLVNAHGDLASDLFAPIFKAPPDLFRGLFVRPRAGVEAAGQWAGAQRRPDDQG